MNENIAKVLLSEEEIQKRVKDWAGRYMTTIKIKTKL